MTKPSKDDLTFVQFNFEWTKKMRREAEEAAKIEGTRALADFVRRAVEDRIKKAHEKKNAE